MQPEQVTIQPQQTQPQAQPALLYQGECWYGPPNGGRTIFSIKRSFVYVYASWIIVTDQKTNQEINRIQITSDTLFTRQLGQVSIKRNAGRKIGMFERGYVFMFYNPFFIFITYWVVFFGKDTARSFLDACNQARPQV